MAAVAYLFGPLSGEILSVYLSDIFVNQPFACSIHCLDIRDQKRLRAVSRYVHLALYLAMN